MSLLLASYILVPVAFVVMMINYRPTNWLWLSFLIVSIFVGVAPFLALAYLATVYVLDKDSPKAKPKESTKAITYHPDGSYTVYKSEDAKASASPMKIAFRVVGGIIAGVAICFGLLIVGLLLLVSASCAGDSKCM